MRLKGFPEFYEIKKVDAKKVTIKEDAAEVINNLKDDGNKIIIISSRSEQNIIYIYDLISRNYSICSLALKD